MAELIKYKVVLMWFVDKGLMSRRFNSYKTAVEYADKQGLNSYHIKSYSTYEKQKENNT